MTATENHSEPQASEDRTERGHPTDEMTAVDPSVAAIRTAVLRALGPTPSMLLVACSGGADSLALAAAVAFLARRHRWRAGLSTVDHQLQPGSAERAAEVADWAAKAGFDPVIVQPVQVGGRTGGPEAAARTARYEALVTAARTHGAPLVLLGHTREDQAETVLLALLRGGGPRGLAGMPARRDQDGVALVRPLLDIGRAQTRSACTAQGLTPWEDPHNSDPAYTRSRARALLTMLATELGPAVVANLARTAKLAGADAELLDALGSAALAAARHPDGALSIAELQACAPAVRTRVLHQWARSLGCPPAALSLVHVDALDALVTAWHGQGPAYLPGGIAVVRSNATLRVRD